LENRIKKIIETLEDKKALEIDTFDLSGKGYIVDKVVIATSLNNKHTMALVSILKDELEESGEEVLRSQEDQDWSVIDLGDIMIHIMQKSQREIYNLEDLLNGFEVKDTLEW
jgi:ribosome silencing factor RsfS/YbeB/iojap